jgi:L-ascorbate metabolism protein UlaG (beta-lactamase superfamily)
MTILVTWLSHSGFHLDINGASVLIDPFLTGNPLATISPDSLPADYILLTHAHGDHLGDTVAIAKRTGATVIGTFEIHVWLQKQGVQRTHAQNTGGGYMHPFGHVKLVKADHSSSFPDGTYGGQACGIVLTADNKRLYFAGDTALFSDMSLIGDMGIDVAFLPIGDNYTMGPDESLRAIEWIRPESAFPIHYNTFDVIAQDPAAWAQQVNNETRAKPIVIDPASHFTV